jgi:hypothetical protein
MKNFELGKDLSLLLNVLIPIKLVIGHRIEGVLIVGSSWITAAASASVGGEFVCAST